MQLTYKYQINYTEDLNKLFINSKNLYNQALYIVKNNLKQDKFIFYNELDKIMKEIYNLDGKINYRLLKAQVSQQILKLLDKDLKSYFKSIKDWSKNKDKYKGQPKLPSYKKDRNILIYTNQACIIKNNYINLDKKTKIHIPQFELYKDKIINFNQIRLIPKTTHIEVEIIYTTNSINKNLNQNKYCSIDLGIDNLASIIFDKNSTELISGKSLKSFNKNYNKIKSKLCSIKDKQKIKGYTNKLNKIERYRSNYINDLFHKISKHIVNNCIKYDIGKIVIGYNKNWKDSSKLSKKVNQTFIQIPYRKLLTYIKYKCEMIGITFIEINESYTSKCDGLALEPVNKRQNYLGKRVKRGLFQSSIGKLINADINGALNILRKVVDNSLNVKEIIDIGLLFNPIKIKHNYFYK